MTANTEKAALEIAAATWFLKHYNDLSDTDYQIIAKQERPDIVVQASDGQILGIEVAHLFYDDMEAKILLGRSESYIHEVESLKALIGKLNSLLQKKADVGKTFSWQYPLFLLIRCASPIFTGEDFLSAEKMLSIPCGVYDEIWLLARDSVMSTGWPDLIQLYKKTVHESESSFKL